MYKTVYGEEVIPSKICIKCKKDLPLSMYRKHGGSNYLRTECIECGNKLNSVRNVIKKSIPAVPPDYCCPICGRDEASVKGQGGKRSGAWCCDHNHTTNQFRGWLCHQCNRALGSMNEDVNRLKSAIEYLELHKNDS